MIRPPSRASAPGFSTTDFRAALGMFATGVTVVTARGPDGAPVGVTAAAASGDAVPGFGALMRAF